MHSYDTTVAIVGGGVVGTAILHTLAHRGVDAVLLEAEPGLAYAASGTNSGILHTGFDSTPGELETQLILRSAELRPALLEALDVPVLPVGAVLVPHRPEDHETIAGLVHGAERNGVEVRIRADDGALLVPGESVTDPVALTHALAASATAAGGEILLDARVVAIETREGGVQLTTESGDTVLARTVVNAAGLHADDIARLVGDESFEIYPRKGEFFVFELADGQALDRIILPVPTKRTKGVLVFPTLDGRVVAGPTAIDLEDKRDWRVRDEARAEVLEKAYAHLPELRDARLVDSYAGLRPAGRGSNYVIRPATTTPAVLNVAAIRSTGLSASIGIAAHVADLLQDAGVAMRPVVAPIRGDVVANPELWWRRTARRRALAE